MNRKKLLIAIAAVVVVAALIATLVSSRQWIAHRSYLRSGSGLAARFTPAQEKKYGTELRYTLNKFWEFYEKGLVSQNDLNDVVEKTKSLRAKKDLTNMDIFDYIGYVSGLYAEAMRRRQSEMFPE
jgi:malic enzyme